MRSVFLQHAANLPTNITGQVEQLNIIVMDFAIFNVYSEAQGYIKYLHDASTLVVPMAAPILATQTGKNDQRMPDWV